ncbi:MAG: esterase-like activity of phytase family protein [Phycisphaerales bacterium]|nr:esterase-like activity of phytase family protein [Phycisphaerales bacterium]
MRHFKILMALGAAGLWTTAASAQTLSVTPRGSATIAGTTTDQNGNSFTITGLSGITYVGQTTPGTYRYVAVMDNSDKLVKLDVQFSANGTISSSTVVGGITLASSKDYEGIAYNAANQSVFVSYENGPGIQEYKLSDGSLLQTVSIPSIFTNNLRSNFGFESLARNAAGTQMWTANEEALTSDGSLSTTSAGTTVRLQKFNVSGNTITAGPQYGYITDKIHAAVNGDSNGYSRSGLSDLVVLPDGKMLALERSFAFNNYIFSTYGNRIYELDFAGAADVSSDPAAPFGSYVTKYQLWTNQSLTNPGNLEGLTSGPVLTGGNLSLLGIVDDGDDISQNRLVAFELTGVVVPEPTSMGVLGAICAAHLMQRRR